MPSVVRDGIETLVAVGLCAQLAAWDLVEWSEGEIPAGAVRAARLGPVEPPNMPDERVLVTPRPAIVVRGQVVDLPIGIAWRGAVDADPLQGLNFLAALQRRLYRLPPITLGGARVSGARVESSGMLPPDTARRPAATASILFRARIPSANA